MKKRQHKKLITRDLLQYGRYNKFTIRKLSLFERVSALILAGALRDCVLMPIAQKMGETPVFISPLGGLTDEFIETHLGEDQL